MFCVHCKIKSEKMKAWLWYTIRSAKDVISLWYVWKGGICWMIWSIRSRGWLSYFFIWERWIVFTILISMFQSSPLDFYAKNLTKAQSYLLISNMERIVWDYRSLAWVLDFTFKIMWCDGSENVLAIKEPYLVLLHIEVARIFPWYRVFIQCIGCENTLGSGHLVQFRDIERTGQVASQCFMRDAIQEDTEASMYVPRRHWINPLISVIKSLVFSRRMASEGRKLTTYVSFQESLFPGYQAVPK